MRVYRQVTSPVRAIKWDPPTNTLEVIRTYLDIPFEPEDIGGYTHDLVEALLLRLKITPGDYLVFDSGEGGGWAWVKGAVFEKFYTEEGDLILS